MTVFRICIFLIVATTVILAEVWLATNPGSVTIFWGDHRIDTSAALFLHVFIIFCFISALAYRAWVAAKRAPQQIRHRNFLGKQRRGHEALSASLISLASGDSNDAMRHAKKASALLDSPASAELLAAQAAQLAGDTEKVQETYQSLRQEPETALVGLRGLMNEALRMGNHSEALRLADESYRLNPNAEGLWSQRLELQIKKCRWIDAGETIVEAMHRKQLSLKTGNRQRAAILYERACIAERNSEKDLQLSLLHEAVKLEPGFITATVKLAELLGFEGKVKKADKLVENLWKKIPHPSLAAAYRSIRVDLDPLMQVKRFERLASKNPGHFESCLAITEAAIGAKLWGEARSQLKVVLDQGNPTRRVCRFMAEIEEGEFGNIEQSRYWLDRVASAETDEAWLCNNCGFEVTVWQACCKNCGVFDTLAWERPLRVVRLTVHQDPSS